MFDVRFLALLALFFLFSDSFGVVIQPRLHDHSSNHRRSMLPATNYIPIEARSDLSTGDASNYPGVSTSHSNSVLSNTVPAAARPDLQASANTRLNRGNPTNLLTQGSVFLVKDFDPRYSTQLKLIPGRTVLVVRNSRTSHTAAQVLIHVEEVGENRNVPLVPSVFSACPEVTFTGGKHWENFALRYLPWSFFEGKVSVGAIASSHIAKLQAAPDVYFKKGDIVQIPASNVHRPDKDKLEWETVLTALCVQSVSGQLKLAKFAVLTGNPGENPYFPVSDLRTIPAYFPGQVLVILEADKHSVITIGRLPTREIDVMGNMIKTFSQNSASIRPGKWIKFEEESLLRSEGDTRVVKTNGKGFFGIVLKWPKKDGLAFVLTVGVCVYDTQNMWGKSYALSRYQVNGVTLKPPWKIIPGYVLIGGVIESFQIYRADKLPRLVKDVLEDSAGQPRPYL